MNIKELINVSKPARYIGGELNSIIKSDNDLLNFCLIFPDIYDLSFHHDSLVLDVTSGTAPKY